MSWEQRQTQKVREGEQRGPRAGEEGFGGEFTGACQCSREQGHAVELRGASSQGTWEPIRFLINAMFENSVRFTEKWREYGEFLYTP